MPIAKGSKRVYFPRVIEAREALMEKAMRFFELQEQIIVEALAAKAFETAAKANQFLIEHMPKEDGVSMIDSSVDNTKQVEGSKVPNIQIGVVLGGQPKQLTQAPAEVIDVDVVPDKTHE